MCANITSGEYPRGGTAKTGLLYPGGNMKNQHKQLSVVDESVMAPIQARIKYVRNVQVMLDRDLAELYGVPVKRLNE